LKLPLPLLLLPSDIVWSSPCPLAYVHSISPDPYDELE
jgi:hypothetical protein